MNSKASVKRSRKLILQLNHVQFIPINQTDYKRNTHINSFKKSSKFLMVKIKNVFFLN